MKEKIKSIFEIETEEEYLKVKDKIDINELNDIAENALHNADYQKAKWLVAHGVNIDHKDCFGHTALFKSDIKTTLFLIKSGANVNIIDENGCNALFYSDEPEKINLLIENNITVNQINRDGENALFYTPADIDNVRCMIDAGIDIHHLNNEGNSILFYADEHVTKFLIEKGINVNQLNKYNENAIYYASYEKTSLLIDKMNSLTLSFFTKEKMDEIKSFGEVLLTPERELLIIKRKSEIEKDSIIENVKSTDNKEISLPKRL